MDAFSVAREQKKRNLYYCIYKWNTIKYTQKQRKYFDVIYLKFIKLTILVN